MNDQIKPIKEIKESTNEDNEIITLPTWNIEPPLEIHKEMTYDEWLENIEVLKNTTRNTSIIDKLSKEPINNNINNLLLDKLLKLIQYKINKCLNKIQYDLEMNAKDINSLELIINTFTKDILYIKKICYLKQIPIEERNIYLESLYSSSNSIFNILEEKSNMIDNTGMFKRILKNKRIKREDLFNEL